MLQKSFKYGAVAGFVAGTATAGKGIYDLCEGIRYRHKERDALQRTIDIIAERKENDHREEQIKEADAVSQTSRPIADSLGRSGKIASGTGLGTLLVSLFGLLGVYKMEGTTIDMHKQLWNHQHAVRYAFNNVETEKIIRIIQTLEPALQGELRKMKIQPKLSGPPR